jgi:hypothetical protein
MRALVRKLKSLAGIVAITGIALAVVLTLLSFCLVFGSFAATGGLADSLNHAGAACFALSRIGWVLALAGGAGFAALTYPAGPQENIIDVTPGKPRAGPPSTNIANVDRPPPSLD